MLNILNNNMDNFFSIAYSTIFDDLIVILMLYSFIKILLMSSVIELIWPTQFFNRRQNIGFQVFKNRTYTEVFLKLNTPNQFVLISNTVFLLYSTF
jgi:hypothetical protein